MPEPSTQCVDNTAPDYPGTTIAIGEKYTVAVMEAVGVGKTIINYFQIDVGFLSVATVFFLCLLRFWDFHTKYPGELRTRFSNLFN